MALALLYTRSGGGKTVNSTRVATKQRGKNLLMCSDNSYVVLRNFERPELDVEIIETYLSDTDNGKVGFVQQFRNAVAANKYDNIIVDNLSDLFDMAILEMEDSGRYKDMRQAYQNVYQTLKRLTREAGRVDCDITFTAWETSVERYLPDGNVVQLIRPKLPEKILDNILGLCNIVGHVEKRVDSKGKEGWLHNLNSSDTLQAKDQLFIRRYCLPEDLFNGGEK